MNMPRWSWNWAWRALMSWSRLQLDPELSPAERWHVAATVIPACLRHYCVDPVRRWSLAYSPKWVLRARLEQAGHGWYRIPTHAAAKHCRLRFGVYPIDAGDLVRFRDGRVSHIAYTGTRHTEILAFRPDGNLAPEPVVPEMQRASDAFFRGSRPDGIGRSAPIQASCG